MTDLDRYFHPHLVQQRGMKVYPDNKGMGKKQTKKKEK
jgi:ribosomal protein L27